MSVGRRGRYLFILWLVYACVISCPLVFAATNMAPASPGIVQHLGEAIPADIICIDDRGQAFPLGNLFDRPVLLSLVYYRCEHVCPQLLVALGQLVSDLGLKPGVDYRIVTVSFDPEDGPPAAAEARKNYTRPLGSDFPAGAWTFATASGTEIARLTGALGFSFKRTMHGFTHPVILAVLTPGGRISRYISPIRYGYGMTFPVRFPPVEMRRFLETAGRGAIESGPRGPLLFCFASEPLGQRGYFQMTTLFGLITLGSLALLFLYLTVSRRRSEEDIPHAP